jgi:hypothetical protein
MLTMPTLQGPKREHSSERSATTEHRFTIKHTPKHQNIQCYMVAFVNKSLPPQQGKEYQHIYSSRKSNSMPQIFDLGLNSK